MIETLTRSPSVSWDAEPATLAVLALLLGNYRCAGMLRCSPWKFAHGVAELRQAGLTPILMRQLADAGHIEYRRDLPPEWRSVNGSEGYLVLTPVGARSARERLLVVRDEPLTSDEERPIIVARPRWDGLVRELTLGRRLIKRFRRPAPNQEGILTAFEEKDWPLRIDDPLPWEQGVRPLVRLRETIKSLHHGQTQPIMRFFIEADGRGIRWKIIE